MYSFFTDLSDAELSRVAARGEAVWLEPDEAVFTLLMLTYKLKHGVEVTRRYERSLPPLTANASELIQVWTNLVDNAIDAMKGKGHLEVRTARDGDGVLVEIIDDGPGIPPDVLPQIFEPFFTTKPAGQGTGLGLDISHRIIVDNHHGTLRVESRPGRTAFQVRLPLGSPAPRPPPDGDAHAPSA